MTHQGSLGPDNDPQFTEIGRLVGDHIVWHDGSPPTPWPQVIPAPSSPSGASGEGPDTKPAVADASEDR